MAFVLVPGSACPAFAASLAQATGARLARTEHQTFPDGEQRVRILDPLRGAEALVAQSTPGDAALVELLLLCDAAREAGARSVTAVAPYLGYARQDRAFQPGESVSSRAAARAIGSACDAAVTVDPHKESVLGHFGRPAHAATAVPALAARLKAWGVDAVLAPDKGARPRAEEAARLIGCPVDHLEKTRLSATEVRMQPKSLDVQGRSVAILDDLIASGGTMLTAARQLRQQGARSVVAACTHGQFTGGALPKLLAGGIDRVLATDTLPVAGCDVESAAPAVAQLLRSQVLA